MSNKAVATPSPEANKALLEDKVTEEDIREFAEDIGIDPDNEPELLWLAERGLLVPLPDDWVCFDDSNEQLCFFNTSTGVRTTVDPGIEYYINLVKRERAKLAAAKKEKEGTKVKDDKEETKKEDMPEAGTSYSGRVRPPAGLPHLRSLESLPGSNTDRRVAFGRLPESPDKSSRDLQLIRSSSAPRSGTEESVFPPSSNVNGGEMRSSLEPIKTPAGRLSPLTDFERLRTEADVSWSSLSTTGVLQPRRSPSWESLVIGAYCGTGTRQGKGTSFPSSNVTAGEMLPFLRPLEISTDSLAAPKGLDVSGQSPCFKCDSAVKERSVSSGGQKISGVLRNNELSWKDSPLKRGHKEHLETERVWKSELDMEQKRMQMVIEKEKRMHFFEEQLRKEEEKEKQKLHEEKEERLQALRQILLSQQKEEEARLTGESAEERRLEIKQKDGFEAKLAQMKKEHERKMGRVREQYSKEAALKEQFQKDKDGPEASSASQLEKIHLQERCDHVSEMPLLSGVSASPRLEGSNWKADGTRPSKDGGSPNAAFVWKTKRLMRDSSQQRERPPTVRKAQRTSTQELGQELRATYPDILKSLEHNSRRLDTVLDILNSLPQRRSDPTPTAGPQPSVSSGPIPHPFAPALPQLLSLLPLYGAPSAAVRLAEPSFRQEPRDSLSGASAQMFNNRWNTLSSGSFRDPTLSCSTPTTSTNSVFGPGRQSVLSSTRMDSQSLQKWIEESKRWLQKADRPPD